MKQPESGMALTAAPCAQALWEAHFGEARQAGCPEAARQGRSPRCEGHQKALTQTLKTRLTRRRRCTSRRTSRRRPARRCRRSSPRVARRTAGCTAPQRLERFRPQPLGPR